MSRGVLSNKMTGSLSPEPKQVGEPTTRNFGKGALQAMGTTQERP